MAHIMHTLVMSSVLLESGRPTARRARPRLLRKATSEGGVSLRGRGEGGVSAAPLRCCAAASPGGLYAPLLLSRVAASTASGGGTPRKEPERAIFEKAVALVQRMGCTMVSTEAAWDKQDERPSWRKVTYKDADGEEHTSAYRSLQSGNSKGKIKKGEPAIFEMAVALVERIGCIMVSTEAAWDEQAEKPSARKVTYKDADGDEHTSKYNDL